MEKEELMSLVKRVYRKTIGYSLETVYRNENGELVKEPSDAYLEQQEIKQRRERLFGKEYNEMFNNKE